jgi:hypothetical protein
MPHYHIRWSTKEILDWEAFDGKAEAEAAAQQLVRLGETYLIVERDGSCPRCRESLKLKKTESDPNQKYPWQQVVFEALAETHHENRIKKVAAAQRQISARIMDLTHCDLNEQAAILEAIQTLRQAAPDQKRRNMEYPEWQQPLLEAVTEIDRHELIEKIRIAELAIRQRLKESHSLSKAEVRALHDGLSTLATLMRTEPKAVRADNERIA